MQHRAPQRNNPSWDERSGGEWIVILSEAKNFSICGIRYFTSLRYVQYDNLCDAIAPTLSAFHSSPVFDHLPSPARRGAFVFDFCSSLHCSSHYYAIVPSGLGGRDCLLSDGGIKAGRSFPENRGGVMFENVYCIILFVLSVSISSFMESLYSSCLFEKRFQWRLTFFTNESVCFQSLNSPLRHSVSV